MTLYRLLVNQVAMLNHVRGGVDGTVQSNGSVELDESDHQFRLLDDSNFGNPDNLDVNEDVVVDVCRGKWVVCQTKAEKRAKVHEKAREEHRKRKKRAREKDRNRRQAEDFWDRYEIPFDYDVAIKGRRSGLLRSSSGNGRAKNTVNHLFILEGFSDGRLSRPSEVYLCSNEAKFRFTDGERYKDSEGNEYMPEVTCKSCQNLMERWLAIDD